MSSRTRTSLVGLTALASLVACTGAKAPPPALARASTQPAAEVATFEGRFDPATGLLTIQTAPAAGVSGPVGRSAYQPFSDNSPGTGPVNTFELVTVTAPAPGLNAAGCGGVGSFDGNITLRSFFNAQAFSSVYVELTSVSLNHEACNSALVTGGMSAAFGLWDYGPLAANGSASQAWSFRFATSERFVFRGRIMAQAAPLAAPANGATAFEWTPSMFMDPPHSFRDVVTTTAHLVFDGVNFVDTKGLITPVMVGTPGAIPMGLTYPPAAYANGFSGASYFVADAAHGGNAIDTSGDFTVCAKFKPGANPPDGVFRVIVAKGDPVDNLTSTGWALAHFGPIPTGTEPEYSFIYRTGQNGDVTRGIGGPQGLQAGPPPSARAYEYVCGGRQLNNIRLGTFGQVASFDIPVTGAFPSPATLPLVIGAAAGGTYPYTDGGVYEVIFDSRAPTLAVMNEIVAVAEGRRTFNGATYPGIPFPAVTAPVDTTVTGADGASYVLSIGSNQPLSTDASGLLDAGKVVAFGGTTAGYGPVLPAGTTDSCIGAEVDSADWTTATGCVVGWAGGGEFGIFFTGGTIAGTNGGAFRTLAAPVPTPGRHKVMVCYATPAVPGTGQAHLYVDGVLAGSTSGADGNAPFDIVAGQIQVGTCNLAGLLTGARVGRVFACPSANPALCQ